MTGVSPIPHQARPYQGRQAGAVTRAVAAALDLIVVVLASIAGYFVVSGVSFVLRPWSFQFPDVALLLGLGCTLLLLILYLTITWSGSGRSYGAKVMGLRVIDRRGRSPRPLNALARAVLSVSFPVGLFWCLVSRERRSLSDVLCRTSVVYDWRAGPL
jgi:uncharacterized RDD family membrane protein YckC